MFSVIRVEDDAADLPEQLGTKHKFWFKLNGRRFLFKEGHPGSGEDWSEKAASELCLLLGLPHAEYELAVWRDRPGVITPSFVPEGGRLVHGNELLARIDKSYPQTTFYHVRHHVLKGVLAILQQKGIRPPLGWNETRWIHTAMDVFVGYLMLDAWIANQDRHHENWALVVTLNREAYLAPTYDHASGLGRNERPETMKARLATRDQGYSMKRYVARARSAFYLSGNRRDPLRTLEAFQTAAKSCPAAASAWLQRLDAITADQVANVFSQLPPERAATVSVEFAQSILALNRERLLADERGGA